MDRLQLDRHVPKSAEYHQRDALLQQRLPIGYVGLKKASTMKNENYSNSEICVKWEDNFQQFETDLPDQLEKALFPSDRNPEFINEADSCYALRQNVLLPMQDLFGSKFIIESKPRIQAFEPDFALSLQGKPFAIIEAKQWNALLDIDLTSSSTSQTVINKLECDDLPRQENLAKYFQTNLHFDNETPAQFNFRMGVKQLRTYLTAMNLEKAYGILTSYCHTYFVVLDQVQNKLEISPVAKYSDTNILQRIAKFIYLAFTAKRNPIKVTPTLSPKKAGVGTDGNEEENTSNEKKSGHKTGRVGTGEGSDRVLRNRGQRNTSENLPYGQFVVGPTLGEGRSGCVLRITNDKGQSFAAKCAGDKHKDIVAELRNEEAIYKKLKSLQGEVVPRFHCSGYLFGFQYTLVLDELDADPIWKHKLSDEEKEAIVAALDRIHKTGVLHGDIRKENIMMDKCKTKHFYFVDFAMSTECHSEETFKEEIGQLRTVLKNDL